MTRALRSSRPEPGSRRTRPAPAPLPPPWHKPGVSRFGDAFTAALARPCVRPPLKSPRPAPVRGSKPAWSCWERPGCGGQPFQPDPARGQASARQSGPLGTLLEDFCRAPAPPAPAWPGPVLLVHVVQYDFAARMDAQPRYPVSLLGRPKAGEILEEGRAPRGGEGAAFAGLRARRRAEPPACFWDPPG